MEIKNMERMRNTGIRFKEIRAQLNFTQSQVAEFIGIDRSLIAKFEKGERSIGAAPLDRACRLFGCDMNVLLGESKFEPIAIAYRAKDLKNEDLDAIAKVQKIALNLRTLKKLAEMEVRC